MNTEIRVNFQQLQDHIAFVRREQAAAADLADYILSIRRVNDSLFYSQYYGLYIKARNLEQRFSLIIETLEDMLSSFSELEMDIKHILIDGIDKV